MIMFSNKVAVKSIWMIFALLLLTANVIAHSDSEVIYRYDSAGRLISVNYSEAFITYSYDSSGNLLRREVKNQGVDSIGEVNEVSTAPMDITVTAGDGNIALASFGLQNTSNSPIDLSDIAVNISVDSAGNVSELRLILDANTNTVADIGELVLTSVTNVPSSGALTFTLLSPLLLGVGDVLSFVVIADF